MPATESEKVFRRIMHLIEGKVVVDLGCGIKKVAPWAIGVDDASESRHFRDTITQSRVDPVSRELSAHYKPETFDVVFSSHTLEHIRCPILDTLKYWATFLKPNGRMILYLPDEGRYQYDPKNPQAKNPGHFHLLTPKMFLELTRSLDELAVEVFEEDPQIPDHYSFLVVLRKVVKGAA